MRYATASELKNDIEFYLADEPVTAKLDSVSERVNRWIRKHRTVVQLSGWMALATIIALGVFLNIVGEKNRDLQASIQREQNAKEAAIVASQRANQELWRTIREAYTSKMAQVSQAIADRHPMRLVEFINQTRPRVGMPFDPRGFEWWLNWYQAFGAAQPIWFGDADVRLAKLLDSGRKSAIWTNNQKLQIIDNQTGQSLLSEDLTFLNHALKLNSPTDLPVSDDGTTVAIPNRNSIQIHRLTASRFEPLMTITLAMPAENYLSSLLLSSDGNTLIAADVADHIWAWNIASDTPQALPLEIDGPKKFLRLSANGRLLGFFDQGQPVVYDVSSKTRITTKEADSGEFYGMSFGQYDTLVVWSNAKAVTFAVDFPTQLTKLWETALPSPRSLLDTSTIQIDREVREWIDLDQDSRRVDPVRLAGRLDSGRQPATVRATILATIEPNRTRLFYREPAGTWPWNRPSYTDGEQPDRVSEFRSVRISEIVDVTLQRDACLLRRGRNSFSIVPFAVWLTESIDCSPHRGPMDRLSWTTDNELVCLTEATTYPSRTMPGSQEFHGPEVTRLDAPGFQLSTAPITIDDSQATISDDGRVLASYGADSFQVVVMNQPADRFTFRLDLPEHLFDNGTVNLFAWNRSATPVGSQQQGVDNFDRVLSGHSAVPAKSLDVPWILVYQNEYARDITRVNDAVTTKLYVIDYQHSILVDTLEIPNAYLDAVVIRRDGREIAVVSSDHKVRAWNILDDRTIHQAWQQDVEGTVTCMTYQGDTSTVALGCDDGDIVFAGPGTRDVAFLSKAHEGSISAIAFSASGARLITAGADNTVRLFEMQRGNEVSRYFVPNTPTCVALSVDDAVLAIGEQDGHVRTMLRATTEDVLTHSLSSLRALGRHAASEDEILRELWADLAGTGGLGDDDIAPSVAALESIRDRLGQLDTNQLRRTFRLALPPHN